MHHDITNKLSESCSGKYLCEGIYCIITWSNILNINFSSFSSFCLKEKNFGVYVWLRSLLMSPSFIWAMHAVMPSNNTVGSLSIGNPQVTWMCINLSHTHSRLTSWSAMTPTWLEELASSICFCERKEIVIPLHVNIYHIWDLPLCGSDRYLHLHNQSFHVLIIWDKINPNQLFFKNNEIHA